MMDDFFRIGLWTEWHENGVKKSEGFYRKPVDTEFCFEDEKFEEWIYWHKNGKLACKGFHDDWNLEGLWMFLDENGVELYKHNFKNVWIGLLWKKLKQEGCLYNLIHIYKCLIFGR
jgi:antitoxin component YwqK of YwqJK toxin-antitoxin module